MSARILGPVLAATFGVAALFADAAPGAEVAAEVAAGASCGEIVLTGAASATIFVDGFESESTAAWGQPYPAAYSTTGNVDLGVAVPVAGAGAEGVLELRWHLPGGPLYQSVALPFAENPAPQARRQLAGYPFAVAVRQLRGAARPERSGPEEASLPVVEASFALAGTAIVESGLWGEWRLEAFLDGSDEACTTPLRFRLEP